MKAWRARSSSGGGFSRSSSAPTVIQVLTDGSPLVQFTFSAQVSAIGDVSAFDVGGDDASGFTTPLPSGVVEVTFGSNHSPGEAWTIDLGFAGLTFVGGGSLANTSGTTI